MKFIIYLSACFLFLSSCSKKLQPTVETIYKDSIVEKKVVRVRDSVVFLPSDSVIIHDTIPCPIDYHQEDSSSKTKITVDIKKGKLTAKCQTDSLQQRIHWLENEYLKEKYSLKTHVETKYIEVPKPVKYTPKWHWYVHWLFLLWLIWNYRISLVTLLRKLIIKI